MALDFYLGTCPRSSTGILIHEYIFLWHIQGFFGCAAKRGKFLNMLSHQRSGEISPFLSLPFGRKKKKNLQGNHHSFLFSINLDKVKKLLI